MNNRLGNKIRKLRENQKMFLRHLAPMLDMDTAQLSKIERGERNVKKETVLRLAKIFNIKADELITLWLADQIYDVVKGDKNALQAMMVAEETLIYSRKNNK